MTKKLLFIAGFCGALLLAGCAGVNLAEAGKPVDLGDGVTVTPPVAWAKVFAAGNSVLTIDGVGLGEVHYWTGVKVGDPIFPVSGKSNAEVGAYNDKMLPNEVMDLLATNLEKNGCQTVKASELSPTMFGTVNGFKFHLSYVLASGLEMQGEAVVAQRGGKLDVLLFDAPTEYYYAHRVQDADQLFSSVQVAAAAPNT